ncbi:tRNA uridine(34) 5-carboxymethylaminomethyl modification radical SAM/GNAT enzyme Elp3 [Methanococcoides sp. SA1]|nr:tRNA uridine(34) 5-carboxymethylaminomethyl modification radical SAM/GNAT enzyme Elp3 [Methanococcoides sp. SA1]
MKSDSKARKKSAKKKQLKTKNQKPKTSIRKPTKTLSGVTPVAVMLPPRPCPHGACLYCPTHNAPQSYTPQSPAVLRARECDYDPKKQIQVRLKSLQAMGHPTEKIELIIMGGTFLSYPEKFQKSFVKSCYDAMNRRASKSLDHAKQINETALHRCIALCIETRPDFCTPKHIKDMLNFGATRVEIGVQAIDDKIYKKVNRGHTVQDVIDATKRLKQAGFKVGYHLMPGIPGSNPKKDIKMFKKIFKSKDFKPDQIKIYPCQVLKGAGIENLYYGGEYCPYTKEQTAEIIRKMLKLTPRYCRIMRIMREIPPHYLIAGTKNIDMRHDIERHLNKGKEKIQEIRFREIGLALRDGIKINTKIFLKTTKYKASGATEYFIEITNPQNILFGLIRLRLEKNSPATIRELHVYGQALTLDSRLSTLDHAQHKGLGKQLMQEAEKIAKKKGNKKIRVISGIGVREYYKKLGYQLDKEKIYMEKEL